MVSTSSEIARLLAAIVDDFPAMLPDNLVGVYLWGSLTYDAFDESCSDIDCVAVTRRDLDEGEFAHVAAWFENQVNENPWTNRIDMRFVIDQEFLDKTSKCCGFYPYLGKLVRHGSDGNPIIWINIAQCGITLWGRDARSIAPPVSEECLNEALKLELNYLREDLAANAGNRSDQAFIHNAYAVLTACRILCTAHHGSLVSKEQAARWALETVAPEWRQVIETAQANRLKNGGQTNPQLEQDALRWVEFVADRARLPRRH